MNTDDQPPYKKPKKQQKVLSFFAKPPTKVVEQNAASKPHETTVNNDFPDVSLSDCDSPKLAETGQADTEVIPSCWTKAQYDFFSQKYSWIYCKNGAIGCKTCKSVNSLGSWRAKSLHVSKEWIEGTVSTTGNKDVSQKALRKKIIKHCNSQSHEKASEILLGKNDKQIEKAILKSTAKAKETTKRCIRTAYFIAFHDRPYTDYPEIIQLQEINGLDLGYILHGKTTCTEMIKCVAAEMRKRICDAIIEKERKIGVIIDESTSLSKKSCLVIYLRAVLDKTPENIFLDICELDRQDALSVKKALIESLSKNGFTGTYLAKHLIAFTSDGASVMLGCKSGVGTLLKKDYPPIILWHCLNHRLELAVYDSINAVSGVNSMQAFFSEVYSIYSMSPKLQRELKSISREVDVELKKVGKIFTIRWIASSFRAVRASWNDYPALYAHFDKLSVDPTVKATERQKYKGLAKKLSTQNFVEDVALLKDCLGQLSVLSETLQDRNINIVEGNRHVQWTINALKKIKVAAVDQQKYDFIAMIGANSSFKGVPLHVYQSRKGYVSFNKAQLLQSLIDNITQRMTKKGNDETLSLLEALIPNKWPDIDTPPWLEGESMVEQLCEKVSVSTKGILASYREYVADPRKPPNIIDEVLIQGVLNTIPISSSEAERGFSKMNIICSDKRTKLTVDNISSLMFISINGPPPYQWNPEKAVSNWLLQHRSAQDCQSRILKKLDYEDLSSIQRFFC